MSALGLWLPGVTRPATPKVNFALHPGATTPRRFFTAVPEELRSELSNVRVNRVEE